MTLAMPILWRPSPAADGSMTSSPARRVRGVSREDALQDLDLATVAQAYHAGEAVYLGRGNFWRWDQDGIPGWLVPSLHDLGFLP